MGYRDDKPVERLTTRVWQFEYTSAHVLFAPSAHREHPAHCFSSTCAHCEHAARLFSSARRFSSARNFAFVKEALRNPQRVKRDFKSSTPRGFQPSNAVLGKDPTRDPCFSKTYAVSHSSTLSNTRDTAVSIRRCDYGLEPHHSALHYQTVCVQVQLLRHPQ
jgi:hypothetical protein